MHVYEYSDLLQHITGFKFKIQYIIVSDSAWKFGLSELSYPIFDTNGNAHKTWKYSNDIEFIFSRY